MQHDPFLPTGEVPPPPRPKSMKPVWVALAIVLLACGFGAVVLGAFNPSPKSAPQPSIAPYAEQGVPDPGVRPTPTPKTAKAPAIKSFGDGTYLVGEDIPAGTYTSPGAEESAFTLCYWNVRAGDETDADYLKGGNADKIKAPQRVKLKKGQQFQTAGCADWIKK